MLGGRLRRAMYMRVMWNAATPPRSARSEGLFSERLSSLIRRHLRMASGLVLFFYISAHLINHALGHCLARRGRSRHVDRDRCLVQLCPAPSCFAGAAAVHFLMALFAVYERRTFLLPPLEIIRIALGFSMPILLIGHAAGTRLAYDMYGAVIRLHAGGPACSGPLASRAGNWA